MPGQRLIAKIGNSNRIITALNSIKYIHIALFNLRGIIIIRLIIP